MSMNKEYRYIIEWFNEWSELQREDFIPVMVDYLSSGSEVEDGSECAVHMNGIVNSMSGADINKDRPMSLFQCRIKLFREWSPHWPVEFKHKLQEKINEIDAKVGEKILNQLKEEGVNLREEETNAAAAVVSHINANGPAALNNSNEANIEQNIADNIDTAQSAAIDDNDNNNVSVSSDNNLAAVLRQETPVDDDDVDDVAVAASLQTQSPAVEIEPVEQVENNASIVIVSSLATALPDTAPTANAANINSAEVPTTA